MLYRNTPKDARPENRWISGTASFLLLERCIAIEKPPIFRSSGTARRNIYFQYPPGYSLPDRSWGCGVFNIDLSMYSEFSKISDFLQTYSIFSKLNMNRTHLCLSLPELSLTMFGASTWGRTESLKWTHYSLINNCTINIFIELHE